MKIDLTQTPNQTSFTNQLTISKATSTSTDASSAISGAENALTKNSALKLALKSAGITRVFITHTIVEQAKKNNAQRTGIKNGKLTVVLNARKSDNGASEILRVIKGLKDVKDLIPPENIEIPADITLTPDLIRQLKQMNTGGLRARFQPLTDSTVNEPYSIESKTDCVPNVIKKVYEGIWVMLGEIPDGYYVLELASGTGSSLAFYTEGQRRKIIPTDCDRAVADPLIRRFPMVPIFLGADMFSFDKNGIAPSPELKSRFKLCASIGTNGISYAKNETELRSLYTGLDNELVINPATNRKTIIHLFQGNLATEKNWGTSTDEALESFFSANLKVLGELGYKAQLMQFTATNMTRIEDANDIQREALAAGANEITKTMNSKAFGRINNDIPEGYFKENLDVLIVLAMKN